MIEKTTNAAGIVEKLATLNRLRLAVEDAKYQIEKLEGVKISALEKEIKDFARDHLVVGETLSGEYLEVHHGKGKTTINPEAVYLLIAWFGKILEPFLLKVGDDVISIRKIRQPDLENGDQPENTQDS